MTAASDRPALGPSPALSALTAPGPDTPIEVDAERLDYDRQSGFITAEGRVRILCGPDELHADRVQVNVNSGDAYALGGIVLRRGAQEIRAEKLHYNFRTRVSSLDAPTVDAAPFHVTAESITSPGGNEYILRNAKVTTCVFRHPHTHYHVRARSITVVPGEHMQARGAVWYFGPVPCFYLPVWYQSLNESTGWRIYPGYRSRWGGYMLTSYRQRLSPWLRAEHRLDYRTERGLAVGEDLKWNLRHGFGDLSLYYLDDREPRGRDRPADAEPLDAGRYRVRLRHSHRIDARTQWLLQANVLSDPEVRRDFFDREYRQARQPENYVSITHRRDVFTLTALANTRLNDFYGNVNRLPEITAGIYRRQIGNRSVYYESRTAGAVLERVRADGEEGDAYSALRFDTAHYFYQPRQFAGWLNLVPRAGYRATWYSDAPELRTTGEDPQLVTKTVSAGATLRHVAEVGTEVAFKAFKRFPDAGGQPWRHVVEPYADWSLRPEPNVAPVDLYQFDNVDTLDTLHQIRVGVRNTFQTRRGSRSVDAANLNLHTTLNLHTAHDEKVLDLLYLDTEFLPADWLTLNVDGVYSLEAETLIRMNTRLALHRERTWTLAVEHRFREAESRLLAVDATFYPGPRWAFNVFGRYEFEISRAEEFGGYVQRSLDCLGIRVGGSMLPGFDRADGTAREDEYRIMLEIWLTAFPEMHLGASH